MKLSYSDGMSFDLVLFGGTGDLAWRKLMPALFQAVRHGTLPAGVPFYIRTGKRLAEREAHIEVNFREAPHAIFSAPPGTANSLVIHLQPRDGLQLHLLAQGQETRRNGPVLAPVHLDLDFDKRFGSERVGAYERLLLDVIAGRLNLFVRSDEQEAAWRWVEPIMEHWAADERGPRAYAAGTWGPSAASAMIARDGFCWSEEC
jgi:glucose-6-phosphate 1-dehydrogenase